MVITIVKMTIIYFNSWHDHLGKPNTTSSRESEMSQSKGRNTEKGIIAIHMTDAQSEGVVTAEHLGRIEEIAVAVRGHIVVGKSHEHDLAGIHQGGIVRMGDGQ